MRRYRKPYPKEFRSKLVALVRGGRNAEELSKEFEPTAAAIRQWVAEADREEGRRSDEVTSNDREELQRLRRENERLREEREILKKAAAWFAQETEKTSKKSSSS